MSKEDKRGKNPNSLKNLKPIKKGEKRALNKFKKDPRSIQIWARINSVELEEIEKARGALGVSKEATWRELVIAMAKAVNGDQKITYKK